MTTDAPNPPTTAAELVHRYKAGERFFKGADLRGADLRGADLRGADLSGANLSGADLAHADLPDADLPDADLSGANLPDADLSGANLAHADLSDAHLPRAYLGRAALVDAALVDAALVDAIFRSANLSGANLSGANLAGADFRSANLSGANLAGASLVGADFRSANLSGANLAGASLSDANLSGANLSNARSNSSRLGSTYLTNVDLTSFCEAHSTTEHLRPSFIDHSTVVRSIHAPQLKNFLARAGVPEVFVEYMVDCARSLREDVFKMLQSTFISYGHPDEPFARKLYEALHRNGVVTFFFPEHAAPGEKLHRMMRTKVNEYDRILLVCSAASLVRKGVLNEIEETLAREARDGGAAYLIPITLDDHVFSGWTPPNADTAQAVRDRVVADFRGADTDPAKFQSALLKLIGALKK